MAFWKKDPKKEIKKKLVKIKKGKARADKAHEEIKKLNNELTDIMHKGDFKSPRIKFIRKRLAILIKQAGA